jgi:hypothetical protein
VKYKTCNNYLETTQADKVAKEKAEEEKKKIAARDAKRTKKVF